MRIQATRLEVAGGKEMEEESDGREEALLGTDQEEESIVGWSIGVTVRIG